MPTSPLEGDVDAMAVFDFTGIPVGDTLQPPFTHEWSPEAALAILPLLPETLKPILNQMLADKRYIDREGQYKSRSAANCSCS